MYYDGKKTVWEFDDETQEKLSTIWETSEDIWEELESEIKDFDNHLSLKIDELRFNGGYLMTDDFNDYVLQCLKIIEKHFESCKKI